MALILIALLSSCGKAKIIEEDDDTEDENVEAQNPYSLEDFDFTLIETIRKLSYYGHRMLIANILVPEDVGYEELYAHGELYMEAMRKDNTEIEAIIVHYYEKEPLRKGYNDPLASAYWAVDHRITISYYPRNEKYHLTEEEIELYDKFQDAYKELTGDYAKPETIDDEYFRKSERYAPYEAIADKLGVNVEEIINVNIKVTLYCLYIPDTMLRD